MQTQYEQSRDNRTDGKYESDYYGGTHNQEPAIQQFIIDKHINGTNLSYEQIPDKSFQTGNGSWQYNPDYIIYFEEVGYPIEVKVQMSDIGETVDLKAWQMQKLAELNGLVLYCTKKQYFIHRAEYLISIGSIIKSKRFGGKNVYSVDTDKVNWEYWLHKPEFMNYV